jgi:diacylglycerol kinase (ATP)
MGSVFRAARVQLSSPGVITYADGEPVAPLPAVAECIPGALSLLGAGRT